MIIELALGLLRGRSRSGFFLRRSRNFLHGWGRSSGTSSSRSACGRSRAASRLRLAALRRSSGAAGRLRLAAGGNRLLAARSRSSGHCTRGWSRGGSAALHFDYLALDRLAAVLGFSGSAECCNDGKGRAQRDQLQIATHVVSLSKMMVMASPASIANDQHPHDTAAQDVLRPTLPGRTSKYATFNGRTNCSDYEGCAGKITVAPLMSNHSELQMLQQESRSAPLSARQ